MEREIYGKKVFIKPRNIENCTICMYISSLEAVRLFLKLISTKLFPHGSYFSYKWDSQKRNCKKEMNVKFLHGQNFKWQKNWFSLNSHHHCHHATANVIRARIILWQKIPMYCAYDNSFNTSS